MSIEKRSQSERLAIIESLLIGINSEIFDGKIDDGFKILQQAVNCQVEVYRMVWELHKWLDESE